jgi:hypothetical protein
MSGVFPYRLLLLHAGKIKPSVPSICANLRIENTTMGQWCTHEGVCYDRRVREERCQTEEIFIMRETQL